MRVETKYEKDGTSSEKNILWLEHVDPPKFVVSIEEQCGMELVGGKTFNISKMMQEGLPVPPGFCVTTETYAYFMEFNNISENDEDISDKIREALIPPLLSEVLRDAYHRYLHGKPCAVRSSSPAEDLKNASFAGQYESFLNVLNEDDFLDAVKKCWASLWSRSATEYRKKMGIKNKDIKMAVLVQEMIPAVASGVLFTKNKMIIEAVWGLGDIFVGGKVTPDHFIIEKKNFRVLEQKISHKDKMSQLDLKTGVKIEKVPEKLKKTPVLEQDRIQELCKLGKKVEKLFGCPQDIEWALYDEKILLIQSRPISVKENPIVWSRANLAEMLPGYVTYLSRVPENRPDFFVVGIRPLLECFGVNDIPDDLRLTCYIYGHIYVNMSAVHETLGKIPGLSPELLDQSMGHKSDEVTSESKPGLFDMMKFLPGAFRILRFFSHLPSDAEKVIPQAVELISDVKHRKLQELTVKELDVLVWEIYDQISQVFQVHACTALANASIFGILQNILEKIDEKGTENLLTVGLKGMSSSQLGVELWRLAEIAKKSPRVSKLILSREPDVLEKMKHFSEGIAFLKEMEISMEEIGDRCSQELELSIPRWEENPYLVLSIIANYLNATARPVKTMDEQKRIREKATDRILKKLSRNPLEKLIFEQILKKSQQFIVIRENLKTTWVKGVSVMRLVYLAIAKKFVQRGILEESDDIFHLKMTEVSEIITGNIQKNLDEIIAERKKEKELFEHLDVPEIIMGKPPPVDELLQKLEPKEELKGLGCSQGVVTGRARVIIDPNESPDLKEGEILISPVTDPGWTPLFVIAGGLVMELGGTLSHGVIIAREYGIPAVAGVKNATKIIKTGQLITVDGNRGIVYIKD